MCSHRSGYSPCPLSPQHPCGSSCAIHHHRFHRHNLHYKNNHIQSLDDKVLSPLAWALSSEFSPPNTHSRQGLGDTGVFQGSQGFPPSGTHITKTQRLRRIPPRFHISYSVVKATLLLLLLLLDVSMGGHIQSNLCLSTKGKT